jgi:hypothetical protein
MLKEYKPGADITIMTSMYTGPRKDKNGKYDSGRLLIMYKDLVTGEKKMEVEENPKYTFNVIDDPYVLPYPQFTVETSKTHTVTVPYKDLDRAVAEEIGMLRVYKDNMMSGNRYQNKIFHSHPKIVNSDQDMESRFREIFAATYANEPFVPTKCYFDIELDIYDEPITDYSRSLYPINAVTVLFEHVNKCYTFLLKNGKNPLIDEFEKLVKEGDPKKELMKHVSEAMGEKNISSYGLDTIEYHILFYEESDEILMLSDIFLMINRIKPDFALAWNMSFDMGYIINRIKELGYAPEEIICPQDAPYKRCEYYVDVRANMDFAERRDKASISSYTVYLDQLIHYASRRKGQTRPRSFSLDYTSEALLDSHKYNYFKVAKNVAELPMVAYPIFVWYNIIDVLNQKCIENKVGDVDYTFNKVLINNTGYHAVHRQTVYLYNRAAMEFAKNGYTIGNSPNRFKERDMTKFPGARVASPHKLADYSRVRIHGAATNMFDNTTDFDATSLYPSIDREFNIAPNTQEFMILIDEPTYDHENKFGDPQFTRGGDLINALHSRNWLEIGARWFGFPSFGDLFDIIREYLNRMSARAPYPFDDEGLLSATRTRDVIDAIRVLEEGELLDIIVRRFDKPNTDTMIDKLKDRKDVAFYDEGSVQDDY